MLAGGGATVLAASLLPGAGWATKTLLDATADAPSIALTSATTAVGLIRSTSNNGELRFTTWNAGTWGLFATVASGVTTRAAPAIAISGMVADVAFQGADFKHYFASYDGTWSPTAEPIGANQSFGPSPPTIATIGADPTIAFAGNDHDLYDHTRTAGTWQAAVGHGLGSTLALTPSIAALASGPDLMIAFVRTTDARIVYTTRTANVWTAPAPIDTNALSNDPVSLAPLPDGGAVLGFRGQNGKVYWSRYTPGAAPPWSPPAGLTAASFDTSSTPAVAQGISGADAEMVFISGGAAMHARLIGGSWTTPATIGGSGLTKVGISSMP